MMMIVMIVSIRNASKTEVVFVLRFEVAEKEGFWRKKEAVLEASCVGC
jgi:hypothetical protein